MTESAWTPVQQLNAPWRASLSREDVDALLHLEDWRSWLSIGVDWGLVFLAMAGVAYWPNPVSVVIALFVTVLRKPELRFQALALGVIAGGAIGNGLDRVLRHGVVDFIKVNYPWGGSWPTFNVADALVFVGVAMLLVYSFVDRGDRTPGEVVG